MMRKDIAALLGKTSFLNGEFSFPVERLEKLFREESDRVWQAAGRARARTLFHKAAERVPAYKDFLRKNKIRHEIIRTEQDFRNIPCTDKKNYIREYPLSARCWDGAIGESDLIAVSSGTTGSPTFWPRGVRQEREAEIIHELIYRYLFRIDRYRTLLLIGFPMGVYVSGVATLVPSLAVARKYAMSIVSVGNNKAELLRVVRLLGNEYDQVILAGHPFFIKDVIETGKEEGVVWRKKRLRMMFCSEGFSEQWRRYVIRVAGIPLRPETAISTYGSSEMLLIGHETPFTIALRMAFEKNDKLRQRFFENAPVPNIFQYNPLFRFIDSVNGELIFTSASGIPLIRFNLHDGGMILPLDEARKVVPRARPTWNLPLVALAGRSDQTIIFYAANIYPEHIHAALNNPTFLKKITGKFTMRKGYLKNMDEYLEINIELRRGVKIRSSTARSIENHAVTTLKKINMEYLFLCDNLDKDLRPRVRLWPYQSEKYFKPGLKPKYIVSA